MEIKLKRVGEVIARCWSVAEAELTKDIAEAQPKPSEELITQTLTGKLRRAVEAASSRRDVEHALLADIKAQVHDVSDDDLRSFKGLVASVNEHDKAHEGAVSAADLGLVILRPRLSMTSSFGQRVKCDRDLARGLLAQAKRSERAGTGRFSWNSFTSKQEKLYPKRRPYYSLLLYRLDGEKLNALEPIRWQLCHKYTFLKTEKWLKDDVFPDQKASVEILAMLFHGDIGTDDRTIIDTVIAPKPKDPRVIEIRVSWPDRQGPPPDLEIRKTHTQHEQQRLVQKLRH